VVTFTLAMAIPASVKRFVGEQQQQQQQATSSTSASLAVNL
jgi:hypothetical protein